MLPPPTEDVPHGAPAAAPAARGLPGVAARWLAPLCLCVALAAALFYQAALLAPRAEDNRAAFSALSEGLDAYREFKVAWRPRLFTNAAAAAAAAAGDWLWAHGVRPPAIDGPYELTVGLWTAGWFLLVGLVWLVAAADRAPFYLLGTYAAVSSGYMPGLVTHVYPWDMPALCTFTLFVVLFARGRAGAILALLPVATGFKESAALLCASFLFLDQPWRRRLVLALLAGGACVLVKTGIDLLTHSPTPLFTFEHRYERGPARAYWLHNMIALGKVHPLLVNAGTLLAFFVLPSRDRATRALKAIAGLFVLASFLFGVIREYRIWFEMIPFALYALAIWCCRDNPLALPAAAAPPAARALTAPVRRRGRPPSAGPAA